MRDRNPEDLPIYQKATEIFELVNALTALIPDDNKMLVHSRDFMLADAGTIKAKIAGAEGGDLYSIRMENATLIRKAARELVTQLQGLRMYGFDAPEYFQLLRDEMEEFRVLFVEWVESFDPWNYILDRWGLFNPPGKSANDEDWDENTGRGFENI
ncbi:MAG: hypothetical protein AAF587_15290 [Bacteroidota bacterium]